MTNGVRPLIVVLLIVCSKFAPVQQQHSRQRSPPQQPQPQHLFVPARHRAQQLRRSLNEGPSLHQFKTVTMPSGHQFVLIPRRVFLEHRSLFAHPLWGLSRQKKVFALRRDGAMVVRPAANATAAQIVAEELGQEGTGESQQTSTTARSDWIDRAVLPRLRNIINALTANQNLKSGNDAHKSQHRKTPFVQVTTTKQRISPPKQRLTQEAEKTPKASVPPLLGALQQTKRPKEHQGASVGERKAGEVRTKETTQQRQQKGDEERRRELAEESERLLAQETGAKGRILKLVRERTFSLGPKAQPIMATTSAAPFRLPPVQVITRTTSQAQATTTTQVPVPPPPTAASTTTTTTTELATTSATTATVATTSTVPLPPASDMSPASASPPGQLPPSDDVIAQLNNASDFMRVAEQLDLMEQFGRKKLRASATVRA